LNKSKRNGEMTLCIWADSTVARPGPTNRPVRLGLSAHATWSREPCSLAAPAAVTVDSGRGRHGEAGNRVGEHRDGVGGPI
jgi:hypothetical protein